MTSGVPLNGKRRLHARWSRELLLPLYRRWLEGERVRDIAKSFNTTCGRLRQAFYHYGYETPIRIPKPRTRSRPRPEPITRVYEPEEHRSTRHYRGSFDI